MPDLTFDDLVPQQSKGSNVSFDDLVPSITPDPDRYIKDFGQSALHSVAYGRPYFPAHAPQRRRPRCRKVRLSKIFVLPNLL